MGGCRCDVLNVLRGDVARDYLRVHLQQDRTDAVGRVVHRCSETGTEWVEERKESGYGDVTVLRRLAQR